MSDRVFLHVGLPKSGTTYVQAMLTANERRLQDHAGVLQPGVDWRERIAAVEDVRGMKSPPIRRASARGAWDRMVAQMAAWPGSSIFSMEWLCVAEPDRIQKIVDDLTPTRVEVIFTVRDLGRTLPASWQEFVQNGGELSWTEYLASVTSDRPRSTVAGTRFWSRQDVATLLGNWTTAVPAEHVHVVTLPQSGASPDVLWQRMCQVLGIDSTGYDGDMSGRSNASLGVESAELMHRLNPLAREAGIEGSRYHQFFKQGMAKRILSEQAGQQSRLVLPTEFHDWARRVSTDQIEAIEKAGVRVVGDLDELRPAFTADTGIQPHEVSDAALLHVAMEALLAMADQGDAGLTTRLARSQRRVTRLQGRVTRLQRRTERLELRVARLQRRVQGFEERPWRAAAAQRLTQVRRRFRRRRH